MSHMGGVERRLQPARSQVHAGTHLELCRVSAQAADGRLPHQLGRDAEDQRRIDLHRQPGRFGELAIELPRAPDRAADDHARATRRRRLQQVQRQLPRHRQQHAGTHFALVLVRALRLGHHDPRAVRVHRPADEQPEFRIDLYLRIGFHHRVRELVHLPVHDQPERPSLGVVTQQHHTSGEVRIGHLRHREQQDRRGARHNLVDSDLLKTLVISVLSIVLADVLEQRVVGHAAIGDGIRVRLLEGHRIVNRDLVPQDRRATPASCAP